jgi:oxalate decarboxylase
LQWIGTRGGNSMTEQDNRIGNDGVSRRSFLGKTSAALVAAASLPLLAAAQQTRDLSRDTHTGINEQELGPKNPGLEAQEPDSMYPPETDAGGQPPFKYPFAFAHKRIEAGGWTRQVTVRDFPLSKKMAGVEMRLISGGVRELHWHVGSEWAYMAAGSARITAVDQKGRAFIDDVNEGDLWLFPGGVPHSIQGLGENGCQFLLVFDDGNFNEFETFLLTDWLHHTPKDVLAKNFGVPESTFDNVPVREKFIFPTELPRPLDEEKKQVYRDKGPVPNTYAFFTGKMEPTKVTAGGSVKIVDRHNFPITNIAAAIVTVRPGGLRELHWHPNADEWQYWIKGQGRMTVFDTGPKASTADFRAGDIGYVKKSLGHYVENTGDTDCVFLGLFKTDRYQEVSLSDWLTHSPPQMVMQTLNISAETLAKFPRNHPGVVP